LSFLWPRRRFTNFDNLEEYIDSINNLKALTMGYVCNSLRGEECYISSLCPHFVPLKLMWLLKSPLDQNPILIYHKFNGNFKSHINNDSTGFFFKLFYLNIDFLYDWIVFLISLRILFRIIFWELMFEIVSLDFFFILYSQKTAAV
jgi:hypothetical protein